MMYRKICSISTSIPSFTFFSCYIINKYHILFEFVLHSKDKRKMFHMSIFCDWFKEFLHQDIHSLNTSFVLFLSSDRLETVSIISASDDNFKNLTNLFSSEKLLCSLYGTSRRLTSPLVITCRFSRLDLALGINDMKGFPLTVGSIITIQLEVDNNTRSDTSRILYYTWTRSSIKPPTQK